jgi:hypothetical protein
MVAKYGKPHELRDRNMLTDAVQPLRYFVCRRCQMVKSMAAEKG